MEAEEALKRAQGVERFVKLLGTWQVSSVTLDRKQDYQLDVFILSHRTSDPIPNMQPKQQQKSKKPKKSKKSKADDGNKNVAHA